MRHKCQRGFHWILVNLLHDFLDNADISIVQKVGQLSKTLQAAVRTYTLCRVHVALSPWIAYPIEFRNVLRRTRSVISGSIVLEVTMRDEWLANDLDVYVPRGVPGWELMAHLIGYEGYIVDSVIESYTQMPEGGLCGKILDTVAGMTSITKLVKRRIGGRLRRIDIIESRDGHALTPVMQFDATWSMNWITADSIIIAYPNLTLRRQGMYKRRKSMADHIHLPAWKAIYIKERGFTTFHMSTGRADLPCRELCRPLLRVSTDGYCMTVPFGNMTDRNTYPRRVWGLRGISPTSSCGHQACPNFGLTSWDVNYAYWYTSSRSL